MPTPEELAAEAAANAAAQAASDKAAADKAAADKAAADAVAAAQRTEQTVPLSRLQAVIAQKAEAERGREALLRELKLANDTLAEHKALSTRKADEGKTPEQIAAERKAAGERAPSPQELQALVAEEATRQNFNERCNTAAVAGRAAHTDFDKVVLGDLTSISPVMGQNGRPVLPVTLLEAALETGQAHEVLYALGQDVTEASRIMALRPVAQAVELAKFASKLTTQAEAEPELDDEGKPIIPNVSRAPAPIKPRVKSGSTKPAWKPEDTENFSTEEWIRNREKQVHAERTRH
jgi:hypothetical protein